MVIHGCLSWRYILNYPSHVKCVGVNGPSEDKIMEFHINYPYVFSKEISKHSCKKHAAVAYYKHIILLYMKLCCLPRDK